MDCDKLGLILLFNYLICSEYKSSECHFLGNLGEVPKVLWCFRPFK